MWPHLAHWLAARSRDSYRAELQNLVIDSALAASLVPLMHFSLLPSVMLVSVTTADKISTGVRGLWRRSLLPMLAALLASGLLNGFRVDITTSMNTLLACLPIMVIHTLAVAASSYQLVRRVQAQNLQLDKLSRFDTLTGLGSRAHWQAMASGLLRQPQEQPATLLLVDVDRFKDTNDRHGHAIGDDLLRAIASCILATLPAGGHAGRLGGDEFAVVLPLGSAAAARVADSLLAQVQALELPRAPACGRRSASGWRRRRPGPATCAHGWKPPIARCTWPRPTGAAACRCSPPRQPMVEHVRGSRIRDATALQWRNCP